MCKRCGCDNLYKDSFAQDRVVSNGWRIVRKGGRIKAAGSWWHAKELESIIGELVFFQIYDYWMEKVEIYRGTFANTIFFCNAKPNTKKETQNKWTNKES